MSNLDLFKKNCEIKNYKQLFYTISNTDFDFGCCADTAPVPNPVAYSEYVCMKPSVKIDEVEDVKMKRNKINI
jgi:hypothetical protein